MSVNLENWMANLPQNVVHHRPIATLKIPGSHDSFSYSLDPNSPLAHTPQNWHKTAFRYAPFLKHAIYRWSVTQSLNCSDQLKAGVRYFDFRVANRKSVDNFEIVHGLHGATVKNILCEISQFLDAHSKEIVLLDFNHFYNFDPFKHGLLIAQIRQIFGQKMCPMQEDLNKVTLNFCWSHGYQVICFYRPHDKSKIIRPNFLWGGHTISSPWANTNNMKTLQTFLSELLHVRKDESNFFVMQGVLTARGRDIMRHVRSSLKDKMALACTQRLSAWIKDLSWSQRSSINVVMLDFVNPTVSHLVVDLNVYFK